MTVLEIGDSQATLPAPRPRPALGPQPPRGESPREAPSGRETATQAAERLVAAHIPRGVDHVREVLIELRYDGQGGRQQLSGNGRLYAGELGGRVFAAALAVADPLVLLTVSHGGQFASHWSLVPAGPSVTARADALRLIRAMRADGDLVLRVDGRADMPPLELAGARDWTPRDEHEWQLFEDLATLEEWSGRTIPMPSELSGDQVAQIGQAAKWARTERIDASLDGPLRLTVAGEDDVAGIDELRMQQDFGVAVVGQDLPLGTGEVRIKVEVVEVRQRDAQDHVVVVAHPRQPEIVFVLRAPPGRRRPARRTQPLTRRVGSRPAAGGEGVVPISARAARPLASVLDDIAAKPVVTAPSSAALLDDLRGDSA